MLNVILPSAVRVSPEMEVDFGPIPPCLVPIAGRVAAERIVEKYPEDTHFYIAIHEAKQSVHDHFEFFPNERIHLVDVGKTISIADTIDKVFAKHPELEQSPFVLNFADTIVEDLDVAQVKADFISIAQTIESQRWTLIQEAAGKITEVSDKEFQLDASDWKMLLGVWGVADTKRYMEVLRGLAPSTNRGAFYQAMTAYYNELASPPQFVESKDYIDCGHSDNYYAARRKLINARFFNSLQFNEQAGTIRKTSENKEKLVDEIRWLQAVPKELRTYVPAVFDYSKDPLNPFVEMEFYSYPSLDEAFVSARFDFDAWEKLFDKLFALIRTAAKYQLTDPHLASDVEEMYLDKTLARLQSVDIAELQTTATINGSLVPGFDSVRERLASVLASRGVLNVGQFQVIHGDLCLGNILYDAKHGLIKLIDARGRFGRFDIYGDVYYDLAKLSHSILGYYDLIMSGRSRVEAVEGGYDIRFKSSDYHKTVGEIFRKYVLHEGYDFNRMRLIESLLFLSMVPLHRDRPDRQLAMSLQGLLLFQEFGGNG